MNPIEHSAPPSQNATVENNSDPITADPRSLTFPPSPWQEEYLSIAQPDSNLGEAALLWFLIVAGVIPMLIAAFRHSSWGVQPTCGLILVVFSAYQLIAMRHSRS